MFVLPIHCRGNAPSLVPVYFFGQYLAYEVQSVSYLLDQTEHYQSINQSVLFQATRPIHEKQRKEKTHKHTVVKQTDSQPVIFP